MAPKKKPTATDPYGVSRLPTSGISAQRVLAPPKPSKPQTIQQRIQSQKRDATKRTIAQAAQGKSPLSVAGRANLAVGGTGGTKPAASSSLAAVDNFLPTVQSAARQQAVTAGMAKAPAMQVGPAVPPGALFDKPSLVNLAEAKLGGKDNVDRTLSGGGSSGSNIGELLARGFGNLGDIRGTEFWNDPSLTTQYSQIGADVGAGGAAAQQKALDALLSVAQGGGATDLERARMLAAEQDVNQWSRSQREAAQQDAAATGMSSSGGALLDALLSTEMGANRLARTSLDTQAMLNQRALDAATGAGQMGTTMRNTDIGVAGKNVDWANAAKSQDAQFRQAESSHAADRAFMSSQNALNRQLRIAEGLLGVDVGENQFGYGAAADATGQNADASAGANQQNIDAMSGFAQGLQQYGGWAGNAGDSAADAADETNENRRNLTGNVVGGYLTGGAKGAGQGAATANTDKEDDK